MENIRLHKTAADLASWLKGELLGDPAHVVEGAATLSEASPSDVSFFANPKYADSAASSKAGCLLLSPASKEIPCAAKSRIIVPDPQAAFGMVLGLLESLRPAKVPTVSPKASVHPEALVEAGADVGDFAVIERGARVASGASIGAQCYVGENAGVGRGSRLYPGVVLREGCSVGERVVVHSGTVIGADGFGFSTDKKTGRHSKIPQIGRVVVEDDVEIGANVTIDRATVGSTLIGRGTKIDNLVQIGHNVRVGRDCLIVSQAGVSGSTVLSDRVILAGQAGVAGHLKVGEGAIVMAQSGVMADLEKGAVVFGSPARPRLEAFRLQALLGRLPEIFDALKKLKKFVP